jgi:hypothetical protein
MSQPDQNILNAMAGGEKINFRSLPFPIPKEKSMKKKLCIIVMMAGLMFWGCTREEKQAEAPAPESMPVVEQAREKVEQATEAVKDATVAVGEAIEEKSKQAAEAVQEKTAATVAEVREKTAAVAVKKEEAVKEVKAVADKLTTTVESVVLDNSYGKINLSHKKHAEAFGCAACHQNGKPGPFTLGKDAGHALCQGCHKEKQAGPTSCPQCHEKKPKAVEGC